MKKEKTTVFILVVLMITGFFLLYVPYNKTEPTGQIIQENITAQPLITKTSAIEEQLLPQQKHEEEVKTEVNESTALQAIEKARKIKEELMVLNLKTNYVNDQLIEAQKAFDGQNVTGLVNQIYSIKNETERKIFVTALNTTFTPEEIKQLLAKSTKIRYDYTKILIHIHLIDQRKNLTFEVMDQISLLNQTISALNTREFNFTEIFEAQKFIKEKFDKEQLDELPTILENTFVRIEQIQLETVRFRAFFKASQQNIISFIKRHPLGISITFFSLTLLGVISFNEIVIIMLRRKIEDYKTEQAVLKDLILKAQNDYFNEGKITKSMYDFKIQKYEEKQLKIKEQLPVLENNLEERENKKYYTPIMNGLRTMMRIIKGRGELNEEELSKLKQMLEKKK